MPDCFMDQNTEQNKNLLAPHKQKSQADNCIQILKNTLEKWKQGIPADRYLSGFFRENHQYGSRDRHVISESIFAYFRWYGWILLLDPENTKPVEWAVLLALAAEGQDLKGLYVCWCQKIGFDEQKFADILKMEGDARIRVAAFAEVLPENHKMLTPEQWIPAWALQEIAPEHREGFIRNLQSRPPLWLRIQKGESRDVIRQLSAETATAGIQIQAHCRNPLALMIKGGKLNLPALSLWRKGSLEVQDFSSQCIGFAAMAGSGEKWWDVCAGSGGTTLQLAKGVGAKGSVLSGDIRGYILQELEKRAVRGGFKQIAVEEYQDDLPPLRHGSFDGVLVDAPCSSSGRWRRNPESRFSLTPEQVDQLVILQKKILARASSAVRKGGVLVYGTCSVFERENLGVVRDFLAAHPEFKLESFPDPHTGKQTEGTLQTLPSDADCDGSFAARFRRIR